MPPRFAYWTILIDNRPTAFRAKDQADLLPTLQQLRRTNPDVALKWFAQGRLWESPEQAREARAPRPKTAERRGRDWRPGGQHRDPRLRTKPDKAARTGGPSRPDRPQGHGGPGQPGKPSAPWRGAGGAGRPRPPRGPEADRRWDRPRPPHEADRDRRSQDARRGDRATPQTPPKHRPYGGARRPFSGDRRPPTGRADQQRPDAWRKPDQGQRSGWTPKAAGGKRPFGKPPWQRDRKEAAGQRERPNWRPKAPPTGKGTARPPAKAETPRGDTESPAKKRGEES